MPDYLPSTHDYPTPLPPRKPGWREVIVGLIFVIIVIISIIVLVVK